MDKIFLYTQKFLAGDIGTEQYKKELLKHVELVDGNRSGNESLSFLESAVEEISEIGAFEEDNNLRLQSLLCDIFNNLAHSLQTSKTKNVFTDILNNQMFGLKKKMVFDMIKECEKTNNKSYGVISDVGEKDNIFVVDIPNCGQVKWHFPKRITIHCRKYPFKIVDNERQLTNKNFILQEKSTSEIEKLSKHNQCVIFSLDIEEMNENLGLGLPTMPELATQVKEPTLEELEILNSEDKQQNIAHEISENF